MSTSAYLVTHLDDDFLEESLRSIEDLVDEIVVVDGAYEWTAGMFAAMGVDPERSGAKTLDILARYGSKVSYYPGLWKDELHKRSFGFDQCRGSTVIRIDSDEIFELDPAGYEAFLASPRQCAELEVPNIVAPRLRSYRLTRKENAPGAALVAVFKKASFPNPSDHLAYLWLVISDEERARFAKPNWSFLYPKRIGTIAHLTSFRTPRTSINRSRFYAFHHAVTTGKIEWGSEARATQNPAEATLAFMSAEENLSWLEGSSIVSGTARLAESGLEPLEVSARTHAFIETAFQEQSNARAELLRFDRRPRVVVAGATTHIDITSLPVAPELRLTFDATPVAATVAVTRLQSSGPVTTDEEVPVTTEGHSILLALEPQPGALRTVLRVNVRFGEQKLARLVGILPALE